MGFRFRKSANIGPLRFNFSKSGVGYSVGGKGFRVTKLADGKTQTTASVPGTGIGYTKVSGSGSGKSSGRAGSGTASGKKKGPVGAAVLIVLLLVGLAGCMASGGESDDSSQPTKQESAAVEKPAAVEPAKPEPETDAPSVAGEEKPASAPEEIPQEQPSKDPEEQPQEQPDKPSEKPAETPAEAPQEKPDAPKEETPAEPGKNATSPAEPPAAPVESTPVKETPAAEAPAIDPQKTMVIGNRNSKIYHELSCSSVNDMSDKNKVPFNSSEEAKASGYKPCSRCH